MPMPSPGSSSSSSSEDEEETSKISAAVIPTDLFSSLTSAMPVPKPKPKSQNERRRNSIDGSEKSIINGLAIKFKKKERKIDTDLLNLKSNRPDKLIEKDESSYHATTPGFRAHIEKRLLQILDSDIEASARDSVWKKREIMKEKKQKGIKLFANVKGVCLGDPDPKKIQEVKEVRTPPKIRPKKHRLNSGSSDSSDEEDKISACVFTVDDIMHENRMLDSLSKSRVELSNKEVKKDESKSGALLVDDDDDNDSDKLAKKCLKEKHKKTKKENCNDDLTEMADECRDEQDIESQKDKKKKRKHSQESSDDKQVVCDDGSGGESPKKKKRKKKKKIKHENVDAS